MTRAIYTLLFYIKRTRELKDGTVPIFARIAVNGQSAEFGLQQSIKPDEWDLERGCVEKTLALTSLHRNSLTISFY